MPSQTRRTRPDSIHPIALPLGVGTTLGIVAVFAPSSVHEVLELLVIGQASLLAIVLSVSLLSLQVSTSRHAPMLSQVYREGTFVAIMRRFGVSILVALGLRTAVPLLPPTVVGIGAGVAAGLATWSFLALFALEERLLAFLNPDPTLDQLVEAVSLSRYRAFTRRNREEGTIARNPLLEIFQIAQTSLDHNDNYGTLRAVEALDRATVKVIDDIGALSSEDQRELDCIHRLFDYWVQVGKTTVQRGADDVLHALLDGLADAGQHALSTTEPHVAAHAIDALSKICREAQEQHRLEPKYLDALTRFVDTDDPEVVGAVMDAVENLEDAGTDPDMLADVVQAYIETAHRESVLQRVERTEQTPSDWRAQLDAFDERAEESGQI